MAVPVFGNGSAFIGALGVSGPRTRFESQDCEAVAATLLDKAAQLSRTLGGT